jgi:transcriptional regulator of acetoin/glycerol metabolism
MIRDRSRHCCRALSAKRPLGIQRRKHLNVHIHIEVSDCAVPIYVKCRFILAFCKTSCMRADIRTRDNTHDANNCRPEVMQNR